MNNDETDICPKCKAKAGTRTVRAAGGIRLVPELHCPMCGWIGYPDLTEQNVILISFANDLGLLDRLKVSCEKNEIDLHANIICMIEACLAEDGV